MGSKIQHLIFHNFWLKLVSVAAAALFWLIVVNVENPEQIRTFTTNVTIENEDVLRESGKYLKNSGEVQSVTFRVEASRNILDRTNGSDFTAVADMKNLIDDSMIPIEISATGMYANSMKISSKEHYLSVSIGRERTSDFVITPTTRGEPADGYALGSCSVKPEKVTVAGPGNIVSKIKSVEAVCDITDMSESGTIKVVPTYFDENGAEVDTTELSFVGYKDTVNVFVEILSRKSVPIVVGYSGELDEESVRIKEITTDPREVDLKGPAENLNEVSAIEIPSKVIDFSKITKDWSTVVNITEYIDSENVSLVSPDKSKVKIKVDVSKVVTKRFKIKTKNITKQNLEYGYEAEFKDKYVSVEISGVESDLAVLSENDIAGSVDVSGLDEGVHSVAVDLALDEEFKASTATTDIKIKRKT